LNRIQLLLILLLLVPGVINFATPIYNYKNPTLAGLPFFYWFQILALALSTFPYVAYTIVEDRRSRVASSIGSGEK
jgi:Protein of unknown function (DUF3311)